MKKKNLLIISTLRRAYYAFSTNWVASCKGPLIDPRKKGIEGPVFGVTFMGPNELSVQAQYVLISRLGFSFILHTTITTVALSRSSISKRRVQVRLKVLK